jgi:hypothetical protein
MDIRTDTEIKASFREIERKLDAMLEDARPRLERERIVSFDESNRTGFDGGGYPAFDWDFRFVRREDFGSEIKRATARLQYREPVLKEDSRKVEVMSAAEIFQIGKPSRVAEATKTVYPLEQFLDLKIEQIVIDSIAAAEKILAKY